MQRIYLEHTPAHSDGMPGGHLYLVPRDTSDPAFDINDPDFFLLGEVIRCSETTPITVFSCSLKYRRRCPAVRRLKASAGHDSGSTPWRTCSSGPP